MTTLDPVMSEEYYKIGRISEAQQTGIYNDFTVALEYYTKAVELNPKHKCAQTGRCRCYFLLKQYLNGIMACNEAIKENSTKIEYYKVLSYRMKCYYQIGRIKETIADCTEIIENLSPKRGSLVNKIIKSAYFIRGCCYAKSGQYSAAIEDYSEIYNIPSEISEYEKCYLDTCQIGWYIKMDEYEKAIEICKEVLDYDANHFYMWVFTGESVEFIKDVYNKLINNPPESKLDIDFSKYYYNPHNIED